MKRCVVKRFQLRTTGGAEVLKTLLWLLWVPLISAPDFTVGLPLNSKSRKNNNPLRLCTALDVPPAKYLLEKISQNSSQSFHFIFRIKSAFTLLNSKASKNAKVNNAVISCAPSKGLLCVYKNMWFLYSKRPMAMAAPLTESSLGTLPYLIQCVERVY